MSTLFDYFGKREKKTTNTTSLERTVQVEKKSLKRTSSLICDQKAIDLKKEPRAQPSISMINTSKFNKKAWAPIDSRRAPLRSSQEPVAPRPITPGPDKVRLHTQKKVSQPRYDWLSDNDVRPYSSSCLSTKKNVGLQKPDIVPYQPSSLIQPKKRKLDTAFVSRDNRSMKSLAHAQPAYHHQALSAEQQAVLDLVTRDQKSLFFTGSAGTGKSVLLRAMIDQLGITYGAALAVTASTGIAAININGCTLHSFAGIGLGNDSAERLVENIKYESKRTKERWVKTKVLIIDEISMVDAELFDKLEKIARLIRNSSEPFGGIQVIASGDFFQLPPVNPNRETRFAFEAESWQRTMRQTVMLSQVFRQTDEKFVKILNEMRLGILSEQAIETFKGLERKPKEIGGIEPTELYPLRKEVDLSNKLRLDALKGRVVEFRAIDKGDTRKAAQCIAPEVIHFKLNAQVMLLKNYDTDLVNGSLGVVVGFVGQGKYGSEKVVQFLRSPQRLKDEFTENGERIKMEVPYPVVRFRNGRELVLEYETWSFELPGSQSLASRSQIPLMLAWAISIHKSQGQTLDHVKVDLDKVFEKGQAYVALSRATSLARLHVLNFSPSKVMAHPKVTQYYQRLHLSTEN